MLGVPQLRQACTEQANGKPDSMTIMASKGAAVVSLEDSA